MDKTALDYTTGTPWLDCDLDGNVTEKTKVSLRDHFALAVNKDRILEIEIPEGYPYAGTTMDSQKLAGTWSHIRISWRS